MDIKKGMIDKVFIVNGGLFLEIKKEIDSQPKR